MNIRTRLIAGITAVALTASGTTVAFAEESPQHDTAPTAQVLYADTTTDDETGSAELSSDPKEIREWISVFTSVINALDSAYRFADRYLTA